MMKLLLTLLFGSTLLFTIATESSAAPQGQDGSTATATETPTPVATSTSPPTITPTIAPTITPTATPAEIRLVARAVANPLNPIVNETFSLFVRVVNEGGVDLYGLNIYLRDINAEWALTPADGLQNVYWPELLSGASQEFERRYVYQPVSGSGREIEIRVEYGYTENQKVKRGVWRDLFTLQILQPTATTTATPTPTRTATSTATPTPTRTATSTPTGTSVPVPIQPPASVPSPVAPEEVRIVVELVTPIAETHGQLPDWSVQNVPGQPYSETRPQTHVYRGYQYPADIFTLNDEPQVCALPASSRQLLLDLGKTPLAVHPGEFFTMDLTMQNIGAEDIFDLFMTWRGFQYSGDGEEFIFIHASAQNWLIGPVPAGEESEPTGKTFFVSNDAPAGLHSGLYEVTYVVGDRSECRTEFEINLFVMIEQ